MDLYEAIEKRCSIRSYENRPVEQDKLKRILDAGRKAPSARNRQEWKFVVVCDVAMRKSLCDAAEQAFIVQAPVIIAVVGLTPAAEMYCGVPTDPVDCAIAMDHMTLAAVAEGLGTCWLGHFKQDAIRRVIGVPETARIVGMLTLGYPSGPTNKPKNRKAFEAVVCFDKF